MRRALVFLVFWSLCLCAPRGALAWTNAQVRDVRANVVLDDGGRARVTLDLGIEVLGGWLTRFDLEGLGESLTLEPERPAWVTTDDGLTVLPRASVEGDGVTLRFEKHDGVRRGLHRLSVAYVAELLSSEGEHGELFSFSLPGFQQSIRPAELTFDAPPNMTVVPDPDSAAEISSRLVNGRRVSTVSRSLWPRATPWTVSFERRASMSRGGMSHASRASVTDRAWSTGFLLAAFVFGLSFSARASFRRAARAASMHAEPWFIRNRRRQLVVAVVAMVAALSWRHALELSLCALLLLSVLSFDRLSPAHAPVHLARVRFLQAADFSASRRARFFAWVGKAPWADVFTLLGACSFVAIVALPFVFPQWADLSQDPWALGLWCALPSLVQSSSRRLPRDAHARLSLLKSEARAMRAVGCAFRFVSYVDPQGVLIEPRLRVTPAARYSGLLRIDVCADSRREVSALELVVVVRRGSSVDTWLTELWGEKSRVISARGHRTAFVMRVNDLGPALETLLSHLSERSASLLSVIDSTSRAA